MKNKGKQNQRGVVLFFSLPIILALSVLVSAMYLNVAMSVQSANNYRHRLESYYAADGQVTKLSQIFIDNYKPIVDQYCDDSTGIGAGVEPYGNYKVKYDITRDSIGVKYIIRAMSFKSLPFNDTAYPTTLNQDIQRYRAAGWVATEDSFLTVPVTFYDYRYSYRNPDFGQMAGHETFQMCPPEIKGMVDSVLGSDSKPVATIKPNDSNYIDAAKCFSTIVDRRDARIWDLPTYGTDPFWKGSNRTCYQECIDAWGWADCQTKTNIGDYPIGYPNNTKYSACRKYVFDSLYFEQDCDSCKNDYPNWYHSSHIDQWFKPSGAPGATFDRETGKWTGLQKLPTSDEAWIGSDYDVSMWNNAPQCADADLYPRDKDSMENIVIYDSLVFWRNAYYIDSCETNGDEPDKFNPEYNKFRYPYKHYWALSTSDDRYDSLHLGVPGKSWLRGWFNPLRGRGFKDDFNRVPDGANWRCTNAPCNKTDDNNYAWTMEIHTKFVYLEGEGQAFEYHGNMWVGDLWVFVNDNLWIDYGAISGGRGFGELLDSSAERLSLETDSVYNLDIFYTNRIEYVLMTMETNLLAWQPPKVKQRFWRRDYGPLD